MSFEFLPLNFPNRNTKELVCLKIYRNFGKEISVTLTNVK